jgi:predicted outer membrane protein
LALPASGQAQAGEAELPAQDLEFAEKAAEGGLMEVQLGKLAQEQTKDEQVVQFGARMVQDHGQANEELMAIAEQKGVQLPQELPEDAQQKYEELQQLSDAEFDEAYMDEMVKDHEKDVELFEQQADSERIRICAPSRKRRFPRCASTWNSQKKFSRRSLQREKMARSRSTRPSWGCQTETGDGAQIRTWPPPGSGRQAICQPDLLNRASVHDYLAWW